MVETVVKFGERIASFARAHAGCDAHHFVDRWREAVMHPSDMGTPRERIYAGMSTCALFASQCLRAALDDVAAAQSDADAVLRSAYVIGMAVADVEHVGAAHDAIEWTVAQGRPQAPFAAGDIVIINGPPYGVHVLVVTSDARVMPDSRWETPTVEGGQADGGVQAFVHEWEARADGRMYPSAASQRAVIAVVRAARFGLDSDPHAGETVDPAADTDPAPPTEPSA